MITCVIIGIISVISCTQADLHMRFNYVTDMSIQEAKAKFLPCLAEVDPSC